MLGSLLRSWRTQAGRSTTEMAEEVEVTRASFHNWEAGHRLPSAKHLGRLCDAYGLADRDRLAAFNALAADQERAQASVA